MRMIFGLDAPTSGSVTVNGTPYRQHRYPLHEVGALLEAKAIHPGRSSYNHLLAVAQSNGFGPRRVREAVSYTHLRAHETDSYLVCRLLLEKKKSPQESIT